MRKLAILALLALELIICGCGTTNTTTTNTTAGGEWEAQLTGGKGDASLLNFVTAFTVTNSGPLTITSFSFFNAGACFANGANEETENGAATLTVSSTNSVTGTLTFRVNSVTPAGNTLTLKGNLTGSSNGTTTTNGTLSNGVVVGTWTLTGGQGNSDCTGQTGSFIMCQGTNTCTTTGA